MYKLQEIASIVNFNFPVFSNSCLEITSVYMQFCRIETTCTVKMRLLYCSYKYLDAVPCPYYCVFGTNLALSGCKCLYQPLLIPLEMI